MNLRVQKEAELKSTEEVRIKAEEEIIHFKDDKAEIMVPEVEQDIITEKKESIRRTDKKENCGIKQINQSEGSIKKNNASFIRIAEPSSKQEQIKETSSSGLQLGIRTVMDNGSSKMQDMIKDSSVQVGQKDMIRTVAETTNTVASNTNTVSRIANNSLRIVRRIGERIKDKVISSGRRNDRENPQKKKGVLKEIVQESSKGLMVGFAVMFSVCLFVCISFLPLALVYLSSSPLSTFLPSGSKSKKAILEEFEELEIGFDLKIDAMKQVHEGHDSSKVTYHVPEIDIPASEYSNAYDMAIVYMLRSIEFGEKEEGQLSDITKPTVEEIFESMCFYEITTEKKDDSKVMVLTVTKKSYLELIDINNLSSEQSKYLEYILKNLIGKKKSDNTSDNNGITKLSKKQREELMKYLTTGEPGSEAVLFAIDKLGLPYSQSKRDSGTHFDCSSLTFYSWKAQGINLSYEGANTAAQQAKYLHDQECKVSYENMKPGDLIFYSWGSNGRWKNISHVAMYCGGGMLVDASSSKGKVVYRAVYSKDNIVLIGRPSKLDES